jgi:hypothetical protein
MRLGSIRTDQKTNEIESYCRDEYFVARFFSVSVQTVRRWRALGTGPRFRKVGQLVRYSLDDCHAWLNSRPAGGETPKVAA